MGYISSRANRFYTKVESGYGIVPAIAASNRIPAISLGVRQGIEAAERRDKMGGRTFGGIPPGARRRTSWELKTYMTNWMDVQADPGHGPLFQAGLGGAPSRFNGGTAGAGCTTTSVVFSGPHGLAVGQALTVGDELRFVATVVNPTSVQLSAPLSKAPAAGEAIGTTVTYFPATDLPSVSVFDCWSPASAVQRIVCGAAVDRFLVRVNSDFHEFEFSGPAQDVIDSSSFAAGEGGLEEFPAEPAPGTFDYAIVPGHMGQAWLGNAPDRFWTLTSALFRLDNDLEMRAREFGSRLPRAVLPGQRKVTVDLGLFEVDDAATRSLYQAARMEAPVNVMFQLGEQAGQLMGVYLPSVVAQTPEFDDGERQLQWKFREARAQGTVDDEMVIAFG